MNKKDILIHIVQILILIIFMCSIVNKEFQNDTYFTIAIGEQVLEHGIEKEEKLVWHKGLEYTNSRWLFDSTIYTINKYLGFTGIYGFVMILAVIQGVIWYLIVNKITKKKIFSFVSTLCTMYLSNYMFFARAQIISFLIFIIEFYIIEKLIETNKYRYSVILILLAILLMNVHASVFPVHFVLYLPYVAEYILYLLKLNKSDKLIVRNINIKPIIIIIIITILLGFCMPKGISPYTDMFKVVGGISTEFIDELQPITIDTNVLFWGSLIMCISILIFTKTKIRVSDGLFILGFALMSLSALRCVYFYYLIAGICIVRLINDCLEEYNFSFDFLNNKVKKYILMMIYIAVIIISIRNLFANLRKDYINTIEYPVSATQYIIENCDTSNMRIFNHFNFGSYLEFKGIKAFIDSRSGIFTEEFNEGVTILEDWINVVEGRENYNTLFNKYNITHALLYNDEIISLYIGTDPNWNLIYQDDIFVIYERIEDK